MESIPKWTHGVKEIGSLGDGKFTIFDVKSGNRGCLMVVVKEDVAEGARAHSNLMWACPNVSR